MLVLGQHPLKEHLRLMPGFTFITTNVYKCIWYVMLNFSLHWIFLNFPSVGPANDHKKTIRKHCMPSIEFILMGRNNWILKRKRKFPSYSIQNINIPSAWGQTVFSVLTRPEAGFSCPIVLRRHTDLGHTHLLWHKKRRKYCISDTHRNQQKLHLGEFFGQFFCFYNTYHKTPCNVCNFNSNYGK